MGCIKAKSDKLDAASLSNVCARKRKHAKDLLTHRLLVVPSVLDGVFVTPGNPLGDFGPLVPQLPLRISQNFHLCFRPNTLLDIRIKHIYPTLLDLLSDATRKSLGNFRPLVIPGGDQRGDDVVLFLGPSTLDKSGL